MATAAPLHNEVAFSSHPRRTRGEVNSLRAHLSALTSRRVRGTYTQRSELAGGGNATANVPLLVAINQTRRNGAHIRACADEEEDDE